MSNCRCIFVQVGRGQWLSRDGTWGNREGPWKVFSLGAYGALMRPCRTAWAYLWGRAQPPYGRSSFQLLAPTISFFRSLCKAHDHRWWLERTSTGKSKALPSGSAPSPPPVDLTHHFTRTHDEGLLTFSLQIHLWHRCLSLAARISISTHIVHSHRQIYTVTLHS